MIEYLLASYNLFSANSTMDLIFECMTLKNGIKPVLWCESWEYICAKGATAFSSDMSETKATPVKCSVEWQDQISCQLL